MNMQSGVAGSLVLVIIVALVFFMAIRIVFWVFASVGHGVGRFFAGSPARSVPHASAVARMDQQMAGVCPNKKCRKVNSPFANYCARCGNPLRPVE